MSQSEGLESLSMSLVWPSMLEAKVSSVEIMYECLEDMMKLPKVVILNIPSSNMSVAFLDSGIENQKGGCIKQNWIISLNTVFHKWYLYCLQVAPCLL